jgi:hypothetical protein
MNWSVIKGIPADSSIPRYLVMLMYERFVEFLKSHEGVEFVPAATICDE